jgi:hypothetical protein
MIAIDELTLWKRNSDGLRQTRIRSPDEAL